MGLCWSEPPAPPVTTYVAKPLQPCRSCGVWVKGNDYCEPCLQKNAMRSIAPSAPSLYPPQPQYGAPQYTYAVPYQQQQMYQYYQTRPPQQQVSTGTAVLGGFVLGAIAQDILDPTE
jgi:hypothetical protein